MEAHLSSSRRRYSSRTTLSSPSEKYMCTIDHGPHTVMFATALKWLHPTTLRSRCVLDPPSTWLSHRSTAYTVPDLYTHPKVTLYTHTLFHRLRHPNATPRPVPFRPRDPRALARPLIHATPIASRAPAPTRNGARFRHRSGQRRARRRTHTPHPALGPCKVRHPHGRARRPL